MPCTGSVKSVDSIMLSCLSPRSPCWGPNAASSLMPSSAASASSECARSRVTDAGCASSATRLPASGRRSAGSSSSLSMPSFIELQRERLAVMADRKIAVVSQAIEAYARFDLELACGAAHGNARIQLLVRERNAVAISRKRVRGPLARGREIEFVIRGQVLAADEYFAAGVLPQPVGAARLARRRDAQAAEISLEEVGRHEKLFRCSANARRNAAQRIAARFRMARERNRVIGCAQPQMSQKKNAKPNGRMTAKRAIDAMRRRSISSSFGSRRSTFARSFAALDRKSVG